MSEWKKGTFLNLKKNYMYKHIIPLRDLFLENSTKKNYYKTNTRRQNFTRKEISEFRSIFHLPDLDRCREVLLTKNLCKVCSMLSVFFLHITFNTPARDSVKKIEWKLRGKCLVLPLLCVEPLKPPH